VTEIYEAPSTGAVQVRAVALRKLELAVTRRLDGLLAGDHHSLLRGSGTELAGGRPYEPGDDVRRMEWNLTARLGDPHVRETEADRELETWMVVDTSASLDFGTAECEKRDLALAAVAAIGFLTARAGNRLGAVLCGGDRLVIVPARAGRAPMAALLARLYDSPRRTTPPAAQADVTAALHSLHRQRRRRGQVVVVSDFADQTDWARPLTHLVARHQTLAIEVRDRREDELPNVGFLALVDPETGARLEVPTGSRRVRERFGEAAAQRRVELQRTLRRAGAQHLVLATDRDWLLDVARFVQTSRRRAGGLATTVAR
jgi:uncharacterized protein (DUF58 family)